LTKATEKI